jgi:hypothetical protein
VKPNETNAPLKKQNFTKNLEIPVYFFSIVPLPLERGDHDPEFYNQYSYCGLITFIPLINGLYDVPHPMTSSLSPLVLDFLLPIGKPWKEYTCFCTLLFRILLPCFFPPSLAL